jgi:hypothetical protein
MPEKTDRFQRWQKISIEYFSYTLNLFVTLTIATLGYWFSLLRDGTFVPGTTARTMMLFSFFSLAVGVTSGLVCVVNRLSDFRATAKRAKPKDRPQQGGETQPCETTPKSAGQDVPSLDETRRLGTLTWALFYIHLAAFVVAIMFLTVALFLTYGGKLA